jgi:hypothetical protein
MARKPNILLVVEDAPERNVLKRALVEVNYRVISRIHGFAAALLTAQERSQPRRRAGDSRDSAAEQPNEDVLAVQGRRDTSPTTMASQSAIPN